MGRKLGPGSVVASEGWALKGMRKAGLVEEWLALERLECLKGRWSGSRSRGREMVWQRRASDGEVGEREALDVLGWGVLRVEMALLRREEIVLRLLEDVREMREERLERKRRRVLRCDRWSVLERPPSMMLM